MLLKYMMEELRKSTMLFFQQYNIKHIKPRQTKNL